MAKTITSGSMSLVLLDRPIAYHRCLAKLTGSVIGGVMLSQAIYWQARTTLPDGWFYKTAEEWEEETYLTRREQETARKKCGKYLMSDLRGIPATLHWKVDLDALGSDLCENKFGGLSQTGLAENAKLDSTNTPNINESETTTENTTELSELDLAFGSRELDVRAERIVKSMATHEEQQGSVEKALEVLTGRRIASNNKSEAKDIADLREWGATPKTLLHFSHYWQVVYAWKGEVKPTVREVWQLWDTAMKWTPPAGNAVKKNKYDTRRPGVMPTVLK